MRNTMLVQHVSSKVIGPLDTLSSDSHTPMNWTIHTVAVMHCSVVPVIGLLCLEASCPRTIRSLAGKFAWGASMRATVGV